jgi:hypothetical protein
MSPELQAELDELEADLTDAEWIELYGGKEKA